MGLFDFLGDKGNSRGEPRARVLIPAARNLSGHRGPEVAVTEHHYVRLWISEMFLKADSKWFSPRFPLAYSVIALDYAGQKTEIVNISGKNKFDIRQADLGHSILRDYALTPLLPFRGGIVEIDCGLVSMFCSSLRPSSVISRPAECAARR
jgi:hypothetical protein